MSKEVEELKERIEKQEEEINYLKKKTKKHKWLILSLLFDKEL